MDILLSLVTLTMMEIVLGVDNIIFIAIIVDRLPVKKDQDFVRNIGIALALLVRLGLLFCISWVMSLTKPLIELFGFSLSGRDLVLLVGGVFLIVKATLELHESVRHTFEHTQAQPSGSTKKSKSALLFQIIILDIVFSLDSVITAVGMAKEVWIMVTAMVIAMVVMLVGAKSISGFVTKYPTLKVLALAFLLLIGFMLVLEGTGTHVGKGYIYFAMFFALGVELINIRVRGKPKAG